MMPILYIGIFGDLLHKNKGGEYEIFSPHATEIFTHQKARWFRRGRVRDYCDRLMKINHLSVASPVGGFKEVS
jgi:hypothetical protein